MTDFQTLAQVSAGGVLNTLVEGFALAGLSWVFVRFFAGRSAVVRFFIWFSTLLAIASLPLLVRTEAATPWHKPELQLSTAWATYLFVAWTAIAGVLLLRLAASGWKIGRMKLHCRKIDEGSHPELAEIVRQQSIRRNVKLLVSDEVRVPAAVGFLKPAVVLPSWTVKELSTAELKVVVLHELAHLRRWDDVTNLAQKVLKAIFFFHPAVWWIESRLALEREIACDDAVLEQTDAKLYGESLVSLAEKACAKKSRLQASLALAQNALGRIRQTSIRLAQILDPSRSTGKRSWAPAVAATACLTVIVALVTPNAPEMISFTPKPVPASSALAAKLSVPPQIEISSHTPAMPASLKVSAHHHARAIIPASAQTRHAKKPEVVLAKATVEQPSPQFFLVVQRTQTDASGSFIWSLCVWHVTPGNSGVQKITERIVMSRI